MTNNSLVPRAPAMEMGTLADPHALGNVLAASGYFSDARDAAQAVVKVLAGAELGFGPIASMTGVYIVKGRVTLSANLMAACVKRHPKYDYRVGEHTDTRADVAFLDATKKCGDCKGSGKVGGARCPDCYGAGLAALGHSEFTMDDARTALLANGENWKKYPRNMLLWRAMSNGAKFFCPDAFSGAPVYTPDELGADIDAETGEILQGDVRPSVMPEPTPEPAPTEAPASAGVVDRSAPADGPAPEPEPEPDRAAKLAENDVAFQGEPVATEDPNRLVTDDEVKKLREFFEKYDAPEPFWRMGLIGHGVSTLDQLRVGQAHEMMETAKKRWESRR